MGSAREARRRSQETSMAQTKRTTAADAAATAMQTKTEREFRRPQTAGSIPRPEMESISAIAPAPHSNSLPASQIPRVARSQSPRLNSLSSISDRPAASVGSVSSRRTPSRERIMAGPLVSDIPAVFAELRNPKRNILNSSAGAIEIWPAGGDDQKGFAHRGDVTRSLSSSMVRRSPQPRLLLDLEAFVEQELKVLRCPEKGPDLSRLYVFRACFEMFTDSFTTYRPLLSRIKQEYDLVLESFDKRIQSIIPMEAELRTIREECNLKVTVLINENSELKKALSEYKDKCKGLEGLLDDGKAELLATKQKLTDMEKEFEESAENARELEARMKNIQQELQEVSTELREVHMRHEDKSSELERAKKLIEIMVPRELLENSAREIIQFREEINVLSEENHSLKEKLNESIDTNNTLGQKIDDYKENYTPRPDWSLASQYLTDDIFIGRHTPEIFAEFCQMVNTINSDFSALKDAMVEPDVDAGSPKLSMRDKGSKLRGDDILTGLGTGPSIPKYLRFKGKIRNRHLSRGQVESFIRDLMASRQSAPTEDAIIPFEDFLYQYLQKKYNVQSMVAEWSYSLIDALKRLDYDADCDTFFRILQGEFSESVYYEQIKIVERMHKMMVKLDGENNAGKITGYLSRNDIKSTIKRTFPTKLDEDISNLVKILESEFPTQNVEYEKIFLENKDGDRPKIVEEIKRQYMSDRSAYLKELEDSIREQGENDLVTLGTVRQALMAIDSKKPKQEMNDYLTRAFEIDEITKESDVVSSNINEVLKAIRFIHVRRHTRKDAIGRRRRTSYLSKPSNSSFSDFTPSPKQIIDEEGHTSYDATNTSS